MLIDRTDVLDLEPSLEIANIKDEEIALLISDKINITNIRTDPSELKLDSITPEFQNGPFISGQNNSVTFGSGQNSRLRVSDNLSRNIPSSSPYGVSSAVALLGLAAVAWRGMKNMFRSTPSNGGKER